MRNVARAVTLYVTTIAVGATAGFREEGEMEAGGRRAIL